jgi:hypothetical protein
MPAETRSCPALLGAALFGADDPERRIQRELLADPAVLSGLAAAAVLSPMGTDLAAHEVARAISGLLAIDIVDVVLGGWKRHRDLQAAARRTLDDPDDHELVSVGEHAIEMHERPSVDVVVDGLLATTLDVDVSVTALIDTLVARVESGLLTGIETGKVTVTGKVKVRQVLIAQSSCVLDAAVDIPLRSGIPLLAATRVTADRGVPRVSTPSSRVPE